MPIEAVPTLITPPISRREAFRYVLAGSFASVFVQTVADNYAENRIEGPNASIGAQAVRVAPMATGLLASAAGRKLTEHSEQTLSRKIKEAVPPPPFSDRPPTSQQEFENEIAGFTESVSGIIEEVANANKNLMRRSFYGKLLTEAGRVFTFGSAIKFGFDSFVQNVSRAARSQQKNRVK